MNKHVPQSDFKTPEVTTGPLPSSRKVYVAGDLHPDIRVPVREIDLHPSAKEAAIPVYDPTGPYTDPLVAIDVEKGLARPRADWVKARGGVEEYEGRDVRPEDNGGAEGKHLARQFPMRHRPMRASSFETPPAAAPQDEAFSVPPPEELSRSEGVSKGERKNPPLTQLEFARAGVITKEMEFVAIRENLGRKKMLEN
ncbi:MAG: phosphomethylpyrimidine synthase, partial [Pseudomonadota bacterium]